MMVQSVSAPGATRKGVVPCRPDPTTWIGNAAVARRRHGGSSYSGDGNIRGAQEIAAAVAQNGRVGVAKDAQLDDSVTRGTGRLDGLPQGRPTRIPRKADDSVRRALGRENAAAAALAAHGFEIKQNPAPDEVARARHESGDVGRPTSNPDYLIEGRVFDCYSPDDGKPIRGIWSEAADKVEDGQTQRVVVNLEGWSGDLAALRRQFLEWPIEGLREVKVITHSGEITQLDLPAANE